MRPRSTRTVNGAQQWQCTSCKQWLPRDQFYSCKRSKHGIKSECKRCHCITTMASRDPERARENNKRWMRESGYAQRPEVRERGLRRSRIRNATVEAKARILANRAVDLGFLVRPEICPRCGATGQIHAHHHDYSKPLEVEWP